MSLSQDWLSSATAYVGDGKTETVVILDESHFRNGRSCNLDFWLLDRASEPKLYELIAAHLAGQPEFTMLSDVVASLDCFPNHKVAITFRAGPQRA